MKEIKTFAVAVILLLALAPAAEATWPGANGAIAFSRTVGTASRPSPTSGSLRPPASSGG
jgi:hypothetical protein